MCHFFLPNQMNMISSSYLTGWASGISICELFFPPLHWERICTDAMPYPVEEHIALSPLQLLGPLLSDPCIHHESVSNGGKIGHKTTIFLKVPSSAQAEQWNTLPSPFRTFSTRDQSIGSPSTSSMRSWSLTGLCGVDIGFLCEISSISHHSPQCFSSVIVKTRQKLEPQ